MPGLPTGTVTFLYTDIEGSTRLVGRLGDRYVAVLTDCRRLISTAVQTGNGWEFDIVGDACFAAFPSATDALAAALAAQRAVRSFSWPEGVPLRVRMGLHTGEPLSVGREYVGIDVHRAARIGMAGYGGQMLLSETTHALVRDRLPEGISIKTLGEHHLKDLVGPQRLFQVVASDLPSDFPPLKSPDRVPNNLPVQVTSFIGRDREIAEVKRLLSTTSLLTLVGAGGAGKTRLALQAAAEVLKEFEDGVWLVELATCSDPDRVPETVASALKIREQAGVQIPETLAGFLLSKHLLLVLDNCEHLVAACARLADTLLRTCPHLRMLITSREPLQIAGEIAYRVPPLTLPDARRPPVAQDSIKSESVRLFLERAVAALRTFTLTDGNAPAIARVCHQLDGIPLAIELAAVRVKGLSVEQIAARLDDRFRLLTGGSRTALPHHQTLRATMDWSFNLLSEPEQVVFRRLSVFAGGCSLEAAEAVCAGGSVHGSEVLDLLARLVDRSLVIAEEQGEAVRYRLLDTVRRYGLERLLEAGQAAEVRRRHRDWYLAQAERAEPEFIGSAQSAWYRRLEPDHDNFREALEWSIEADPDAGLRLAAALHWYWHTRGYLSEARGWLQRTLSASGAATTITRAKALHAAAWLAASQRDYTQATTLGEASLLQFQELGEKQRGAFSLVLLAHVAHGQDDNERATAQLEQSLAIFREIGHKRGIGISLNELGEVVRRRGDYVGARALYEEALPLLRELGEERMTGIALHNLGYVAQHEGDHGRALALFKESLALRLKLGHKMGIAYCLVGLASVAAAQGQPEKAARLLGAAEALLGSIGGHLHRADLIEHDRTVAAVRAGLDEAALAVAWSEGRAITLDQAVEYAQNV